MSFVIAYNLTQSFNYTFNAKLKNGVVNVPMYTGVELRKASIEQLWILVLKTTTTTQVQVGSLIAPAAIFDSGTPIILNAGQYNEMLQGTGIASFTAPVYLTFQVNPVLTGIINIKLNYTLFT